MNEDRFKIEYKKSVDSFELPKNLEADIISRLRAVSAELEEAPASSVTEIKDIKRKSFKRYLWTAAAAVLAVVIGAVCVTSVISLIPRTQQVRFKVKNAVNAASVSGVRVVFRGSDGELIRDGKGDVLTALSDRDGEVKAELPTEADFTAELELDGYIPISTSGDGENVYISPVMNGNTYRAVLSWTEDCDLDAYLSISTEDKTEYVYYFESDIRDKDGEVTAALDIDSETPHAPETVTFNTSGEAVYRFSVASYSALKESRNSIPRGARVALYKGDECIDVFELNEDTNGNVWGVFEITGDKITEINDQYTVGAMTDIR